MLFGSAEFCINCGTNQICYNNTIKKPTEVHNYDMYEVYSKQFDPEIALVGT